MCSCRLAVFPQAKVWPCNQHCIGRWLVQLEQLAPQRYDLAIELAKIQRLIKGYGETHERGWRNFCRLAALIDMLQTRPDGAEMLARLCAAALADEHGIELERTLTQLHDQS